MFWIAIALLLPFAGSLLGTEAFRRYAIRSNMIDVPNMRSSHATPTPRGGGVAFAITILTALAAIAWAMPGELVVILGILGGGTMIATVGALDDRFGLGARIRLVVHFIAAIWFLYWMDPGTVTIGGVELASWLVWPLAVVSLVWYTNLYNFMDGLDGLAGSQAVVAASAAAAIGFATADYLLAFLMLATVGSVSGFLVWNWSPAKIFMGDCGSGFLGFVFGTAIVIGHRHSSMPLPAGILLLIVFVLDATLTLLRRVMLGERWYQPHRQHSVQRATLMGASHKQVVLTAIPCFAGAGMMAIQAALGDFGVLLLMGYTGLMVALWTLVNQVYLGRVHVLGLNGEEAHVAGNHGVDGKRWHRARLYLETRSLLARFSEWWRPALEKDLLTEATTFAKKLNYRIAPDRLAGQAGGSYTLDNEEWIVVDLDLPRGRQAEQILAVIHHRLGFEEPMSAELRRELMRVSLAGQRKAA